MSNTTNHPQVGDEGYTQVWTDRWPVTVIAVSGNTVTVQEDSYSETKPYSNDWIIVPNPNGRISTYTLRKNGRWILKGSSMKNGFVLRFNHNDSDFQRRYYDYSL
jgi:hypothetical protein